jgi:hypothetical protein
MSKKGRERLIEQVTGAAQRFTPDEASMTRREVQEALKAAGCDPDALREQLNATSRALADAQRAKGRPAPEYLRQVIDMTGPPEVLPKEERSALQKAREWIQGLTAGPGTLPERLVFVQNYRSRGDLSEEDKQLLDRAEESLRSELEGKPRK